jgi:hypothetical protein
MTRWKWRAMRSGAILRGFLAAGLIAFGGAEARAQYFAKDAIVRDLAQGVEWMRCSVGQSWDEATQRCGGTVRRLSHDMVPAAVAEAEAAHGPGWRLPTRDELEALVCAECGPPRIDPEVFPDTDPDAYWTSDRNFWAPRHYWSVNFMTGHRYGRFFPYQELPVRLVRDR